MSKKPDARAFLAGMSNAPAEEPAEPKPALKVVPRGPAKAEAPEAEGAPAVETKKRVRLKHFGSYLDAETLEKAALLRVRLGLDNSGLVKLAIDELARKHDAKRTFGDA